MTQQAESLIQKVNQILIQRENREYVCHLEDECPEESIFISYQKITIENINLVFLKQLVMLDTENEWIRWLQQGLNYGIEFTLRLGFEDVTLVPWQLLTKWPLHIISKNDKQLFVINKQHITYTDVMLIKNEYQLVKLQAQKLTDLALESLQKNNISISERIDSKCIWE